MASRGMRSHHAALRQHVAANVRPTHIRRCPPPTRIGLIERLQTSSAIQTRVTAKLISLPLDIRRPYDTVECQDFKLSLRHSFESVIRQRQTDREVGTQSHGAHELAGPPKMTTSLQESRHEYQSPVEPPSRERDPADLAANCLHHADDDLQ